MIYSQVAGSYVAQNLGHVAKNLVALPKTKSQVAQFFLSFVKTPVYSKSLWCC